MRRMQQAPRMPTIVVGTLLTLFAAAALFLEALPARIAGIPMATIGVWAAIAAFAILLLGVFFEGI